ncbi:MAG: OmpA family protein [Alphaproteobacteria bacterium]|nr:OmpA family protein [Alphaproteobacteria bacterium]
MTEISFRRLARASFILAVAAAAAIWSGAAIAQVQMYPGEDVTVNPWAVPQPSTVPNLPPVHLHPPHPTRHAPRHRPRATVKARAVTRHRHEAAASQAHPAARRGIPAHARVHAPASKAATSGHAKAASIPFSFAPEQAPAAPAVVPPKNAAAVPQAPAAAASRAPAPAAATPLHVTLPKGLSKQASVLFDRNSFTLSDNTTATLNDLAFSLKTALASGASRVELVGYGGNPGDTSSAARRLSLERALAVRQALIADGVPAERIDVRALGGVPASDHGATDRVDIFVKS